MRCARLQTKQAFLLRSRRKTGPIARSMLFRATMRAHRSKASTQSASRSHTERLLQACRALLLRARHMPHSDLDSTAEKGSCDQVYLCYGCQEISG